VKISLLSIFRFVQSDENLLHNNNLRVLAYTANIWRAVNINENVVTQIFLVNTENISDEFNAN
jgi:hypothetical protein